jgi:hypothetical protein
VQIAFLVPQVNVNSSFFNPQKFILREVLVPRKFVSGNHVFGSHDEVLRTIVFWADLQHEVAMVRLSPYPPLTLISLQQEGPWSSLGSGCGTGLC